MSRHLHVLIIEDSEDDTQLFLLELRRLGYEVDFERVDTADAMRAVLTEKVWDLILSDYTMPRFSALHALDVLKASRLDLPFIIISGTIGEETAVAALKAGANDFLIKGNFAKLGPVIERELQEAESRRERKRAEEMRAASEQRFGALIENAPDGITVVDAKGIVIYVTPAVERILGYSRAETLGRAAIEYVHPEDGSRLRRELARLTRKPGQALVQYRFRHKDGSWRWLESTISNLIAESSVEGIVFNYRDITERKRSEEAALESEARYHRVLDAMMEGCQIIDFDWRYVYVNDVVAEQGQRKREDLLNHTMMEIYPGIENTELFAALRKCMEERTPKRMENQFVFPDGSIGWFELSIQPAREGIFILSTDITERKRSADKLNYHARLLRHINDAVIATDDQLHITAWNRAAEKMYGWSSKEVMGRNVSEILSSGLTDEQQAEARELLMESSASRREEIHQCEDGRSIYVETNTIALIDEHGKMTGYVSVNRDITERKRAEEQTQLQLQRLRALRAIDIAISSSFNLSLTLEILLDHVIAQLNSDAAAVLLFDPSTKTLEYAASRGFRSTAIREARVRLGEGIAGTAILERRLIHIPNLMESGREFTRTALIIGESFVDYYCVPLIVKGDVKGVLEIFHRSVLAGSREWLDFLETLAGQAAIAIENATLFEDLQHSNRELFQAYDATIEGWSHALDLRDKETEGHTQRVTEMTLNLARAFGLPEEELLYVRWGALLHDIGKMGVPDNILLKPGELTHEEWQIMRQHPEFAYNMLAPITYLRRALDIPYYHHEKWDGTGYPRGLKGEEIPLVARLFAVVDIWDAVRSDRPYRPAWTKEKALGHIESLSGAHLDPRVVNKFLELIGG